MDPRWTPLGYLLVPLHHECHVALDLQLAILHTVAVDRWNRCELWANSKSLGLSLDGSWVGQHSSSPHRYHHVKLNITGTASSPSAKDVKGLGQLSHFYVLMVHLLHATRASSTLLLSWGVGPTSLSAASNEAQGISPALMNSQAAIPLVASS